MLDSQERASKNDWEVFRKTRSNPYNTRLKESIIKGNFIQK